MAKRLVSAPCDYEPWPVEYLIDDEESERKEDSPKPPNTKEEKRVSSAMDHDCGETTRRSDGFG